MQQEQVCMANQKELFCKQIEVLRPPKVLFMHKAITSATKQKNLLKYCPTGVLNSYWVVQYYQNPRARHYDSPPLYFQLQSGCTKAQDHLWPMRQSTKRKNQWCRIFVETTKVQSYPHSCQITGMLAFFVQDSERRSAQTQSCQD